MSNSFTAFLPELVLLLGALGLFVVALGEGRARLAKRVALLTALATTLVSALCLGQEATLFSGAYRVDAFSQFLKLVFALYAFELKDRHCVAPELYDKITL